MAVCSVTFPNIRDFFFLKSFILDYSHQLNRLFQTCSVVQTSYRCVHKWSSTYVADRLNYDTFPINLKY